MSTNKIIAQLEAEQATKELPDFSPGDTVVVDVVEEEIRLRALELVKGETPS